MGVMLETPIIAESVIQNMICRFGLRITGGGGGSGGFIALGRISVSGGAGGVAVVCKII
jgi:hypothetical protein